MGVYKNEKTVLLRQRELRQFLSFCPISGNCITGLTLLITPFQGIMAKGVFQRLRIGCLGILACSSDDRRF